MTTIHTALQQAARKLTASGIDTAALDARVLLGHVLGVTREYLIAESENTLNDMELQSFDIAVAQRAQRAPISHIVGKREFWGLDFAVTADTLDPRADSETIVEAALSHIGDRNQVLRVADLGTGTGCLLLALLSELQPSTGVGVDISEKALNVARRNAEQLGFAARTEWIQSNWGSALQERFDVIVSNPPYIATCDSDTLSPGVYQFEPHTALFGGDDGLECYRALCTDLPRLLTPNGVAIIELGAGQLTDVTAIAKDHGLEKREVRNDLAGIARALTLGVAH